MSTDLLPKAAASQPAISALAILREHTAALHTQVEAAISLNDALHSLGTYHHLLQKYLVLFRAFEAELHQHTSLLAHLPGYVYQPRVAALEYDLASPALALLPSDAPRRTPALPSIADLDSLLGVLYVVEGSSLGGQFIYREIQPKLNLSSTTGAAFFYGSGEHTGPGWKRFTLLLDQHILHPDRAASSAAAMFHTFQQALQPDFQGTHPA